MRKDIHDFFKGFFQSHDEQTGELRWAANPENPVLLRWLLILLNMAFFIGALVIVGMIFVLPIGLVILVASPAKTSKAAWEYITR